VSPVLAGLLSLVLPGAGQIYIGQKLKGGVLLALSLLTCGLLGLLNILLAIDAWGLARRMSKGKAIKRFEAWWILKLVGDLVEDIFD